MMNILTFQTGREQKHNLLSWTFSCYFNRHKIVSSLQLLQEAAIYLLPQPRKTKSFFSHYFVYNISHVIWSFKQLPPTSMEGLQMWNFSFLFPCVTVFLPLCYHTLQSSPELLLPLAYIKIKTPLFLDLLTSLNYSLEYVICNNFLADSSDFYWLVQRRNNASLLIQVRSIQTYCTVYTIYKLLQHVLTIICNHLWGVPEVEINLICILLNAWKTYNIKCIFSVLKLSLSRHIFIICPT